MKNYSRIRQYRIYFEQLRKLMNAYWEILPSQQIQIGQVSYKDSDKSLVIRKQILNLLPYVNGATEFFGLGYVVKSYPAPAIGGPIIPVNLYNSIINPQIGHKIIEKTMIIDAVEKSIAVAKGAEKAALVYWLCPWNWFIDLTALIIRIPFIILRRAGLPDKIEENIISHAIKVIFIIIITTVQISRKPTLAEYPAVYPIFDEMVH